MILRLEDQEDKDKAMKSEISRRRAQQEELRQKERHRQHEQREQGEPRQDNTGKFSAH
jgi:hypothetical protein